MELEQKPGVSGFLFTFCSKTKHRVENVNIERLKLTLPSVRSETQNRRLWREIWLEVKIIISRVGGS